MWRIAKHTLEEATGVVGHVLLCVFLRVPCHVHEQLDGVFHWFQVAHVEDPHTLDAVVVGQRELFEHLLRLCHVKPFRVARCTHIVHVVVDAPAALAVMLLVGDRHAADVAPVVVADEYDDIVGHAETGVVVVLNLFI